MQGRGKKAVRLLGFRVLFWLVTAAGLYWGGAAVGRNACRGLLREVLWNQFRIEKAGLESGAVLWMAVSGGIFLLMLLPVLFRGRGWSLLALWKGMSTGSRIAFRRLTEPSSGAGRLFLDALPGTVLILALFFLAARRQEREVRR